MNSEYELILKIIICWILVPHEIIHVSLSIDTNLYNMTQNIQIKFYL